MEAIQRELSNPRYDRNTLRFFMDQSSTDITLNTINTMLSIAERIAIKKRNIHGGLVSQKRKISRFINGEYVNIFEVHQASSKSTMINVDDVRIQTHVIPFKYVVSNKIYEIERKQSVLVQQLARMLTDRQRELFIASFDLNSDMGEVDSPFHYVNWKNYFETLENNRRELEASEADETGENIANVSTLDQNATLGATTAGSFLQSFTADTDTDPAQGLSFPATGVSIRPPNDNPYFNFFYSLQAST